MSLSLSEFNALNLDRAREELERCCGSSRWVEAMNHARPFSSIDELYSQADRIWNSLSREDWLEAFKHHPRIGEQGLRAKFASTASWAEQEQKGVTGASEETLQALLKGNEQYERSFGHVFLICATGKSAEEMLQSMRSRASNDASTELKVAAGEQAKITRIRLERMISS
jgi:2-oxo-4-hydroxy-4-carboxy-5-ureidoimidazoline decarboxylase